MEFLSNILVKAGLIVEGTTDLQGTSTAVTPSSGDNSTKIATTAFVNAQGYVTASSVTTFTNKSGNISQWTNDSGYITTISGIAAGGELSGTYPNPTLVNSAVIGKVLTGLNLGSGGTIASTDTILQAFGKVQNQISAMVGGVLYQGTWNANTNSPTLTSSVGTRGYYYIVSVAGSTNLNGITDWKVGDWAIFNGSTWDKVDNTDAVSSVNGYTGAVSLTTADIPEVTNLYYTDARARAAISLTTTGSSGAATYNSSTGALNIPNYTSALSGYVPYTGATSTVNLGSQELYAAFVYGTSAVESLAFSARNTLSSGSPVSIFNGWNAETALGVNITQEYDGTGYIMRLGTNDNNTGNPITAIQINRDQSVDVSNGLIAEKTASAGWTPLVGLKRSGTIYGYLGLNASDVVTVLNAAGNGVGALTAGAFTGSSIITSGGATFNLVANTGTNSHEAMSNGKFRLFATTTGGAFLEGQGSTNDVTIANKNGSSVITIPTGTQTVEFDGAIYLKTNAVPLYGRNAANTTYRELIKLSSANEVTIAGNGDAIVFGGNATASGSMQVQGITTLNGALTGTSASFSGNLSAVNGTFSGTGYFGNSSTSSFSEQVKASSTAIGRIVVSHTNTSSNRQSDILFAEGSTNLGQIGTIVGNGTIPDQLWIRSATALPIGFYTNDVLRYTIDASGNNTWTGNGEFGGTIQTVAPSHGSAAAWRFGAYGGLGGTTITGYVPVTIGGSNYYLALTTPP